MPRRRPGYRWRASRRSRPRRRPRSPPRCRRRRRLRRPQRSARALDERRAERCAAASTAAGGRARAAQARRRPQRAVARLLGALELFSRDPPPPLLVSPADARDAVRAMILAKAIAPELEARAQALRRRGRHAARAAPPGRAGQRRPVRRRERAGGPPGPAGRGARPTPACWRRRAGARSRAGRAWTRRRRRPASLAPADGRPAVRFGGAARRTG